MPLVGRRGQSALNVLQSSTSSLSDIAVARPVDPSYGDKELRAGRTILAALRGWRLRRSWNRLVRYSVMHTRLDRRVNVLKQNELERRAALVIWRAWKRSRSFSGLVFKV